MRDFRFSELSLLDKIILLVAGLLLAGAWWIYSNTNDTSVEPTANQTKVENWCPSDFYAYDSNLAYRYINDESCGLAVCVEVISRMGCPNNLYGEIQFKDKNGVIFDEDNDFMLSLPAKTKGELTFRLSRLNIERFKSWTEPTFSCN
jgi:hypothetical protein